MKFEQILKVAQRGGASDIILKVNSVPRFRHQGEMISLSDGKKVSSSIMTSWLEEILPTQLRDTLEKEGSIDFAYQSSFDSRFRVNVFKQQQQIGMVLRVLSNHIRTLEELQFPPIVSSFAQLKRGLVLVTGATGSGKTTTLAAIIQKINTDRAAHILTIEDPIEFVYKDENSTINQREIGIDVDSFATALRAALRQNPDVILVGELRDKEVIETALMAAETGHLVFATIHTTDAVESLTRLMSYFPPEQHATMRSQLAGTLQAVVSQRLVPRADNQGMTAATEILIVNSLIKECILKHDSFEAIADAISKGEETYGMQTFDQSLLQLCNKQIITQEEALNQATSKDNMMLLLSGISHS